MNQTSLVGRPLHQLTKAMVSFAEKRGLWSGPLSLSSPELARLWGGGSTSTGLSVTESSALTYSVVWACVNNISTDVASLPLILYKREPNGGKTQLRDHKLFRLLHDEPNAEMSSMTFRGTIQAHALTSGNGYAEIVRDGAGRPTALWPITPDRVTPKRDRNNQLYYEVTQLDGRIVTVARENMFHLPGLSYDGTVGYSMTAQAREAIALGLASERFGGTFFGNGATMGGVFAHPGRMSEPAMKNFRESVNAQHQGVERAHKFLVVEEGMTYHKLGVDPDHAQFLETRLHQVEEICRFYRMPPHKVQHLLRSTNNNIEHQGIEYYSDTLRPWCVRWEQEIRRKLIAPSERMIQLAEHKIEGVLRGDLQSRYAAYAVGRQWGWLSANRICELENMDPLPAGGDVFLVPMNMSPADRINEIVDKQVAPDPAAPALADNGNDEEQQARDLADAIRAALVDVEARIADAATKAAAAEADALRWKDSADVFRADATAHRAQQVEAEQEAGRLRALVLEATERADRLAAEKQAHADAEAALRQQVEEAHAEADAFKVVQAEEVARLKAEAEAIEARAAQDRARLEAEHRFMQETAVAAQGILEQLHTQIAETNSRHAETAQALVEAREAHQATGAEANRLQAALEALQASLTALEAEREALRTDYAVVKAAAEQAHAEREAAVQQVGQAMADAEALRQRLEAEAAALQSSVATLEAERAALRADHDAVKTAAEQAHAERDAAVTQASQLSAAAEAARRQLEAEVSKLAAVSAEEQAAHQATHALLKATKKAEIDRLHKLNISQRGQIEYTFGLLVNKEVERIKRNLQAPAKLKAWAADFYTLHLETCIDALRPSMRAHLTLIGSTEDVDRYTRQLIQPLLATAQAQLRAVADGDPEEFQTAIDALLARWLRERPLAVATLIQEEGATHVTDL